MTALRTQTKRSAAASRGRRAPEIPDLHSQLEALLDCVWDSESNWRLDDRIDLATKTKRHLSSH